MSSVKVLYTPFSIIAGLISHRLGKKAFAAVWGKVSDEPKPKPTQPEVSLARVAFAAALEAATLAGITAASQAIASRTFHYLFGLWPGKAPKPDPADEAAASSAL
jgi:hypothetical protein